MEQGELQTVLLISYWQKWMVLEQKKTIFFVGATNRPQILDEAIIRPVNI